MHFDIRPMRRNGKPIPRREFDTAVPFRGDVYIRMDQKSPMGRPSLIAETLRTAPNALALHPLYDVQVHGMATNALVITGVEFIGNTVYAQSWHCMVPAR